jgi:RNA polymerase sigma-70 factor (ECF subfamily)
MLETGGRFVEDTAIIDLYLEREEDAIAQTAEKYGGRLKAISLGIVQDSETAEECENDTYLQAWDCIPPSEPYGYLFSFLARIIRHISIDICRSRSRLKRSGFVVELTTEMEQCIPASDDPAAEVDKKLLGRLIGEYLSTLSVEKRNIFLRRYWYMDSVSEIANKLAIGESKVKTTLFRCRNELRTYLEKEGYQL